jgi:formylglycine-generating enzyme required for sulfatase activity
MRFVLVQPGTFLMGSPWSEACRENDERQHEVTITRAFYLGACPVTQGQWKAVMGTNPSYFSRTGKGKESVKDVSDPDLDLFPVEQTSWQDVVSEEAGAGRDYRLPTEAEWEYACRGGHLIPDVGGKHTLPFHFDQPCASLSSHQANFNGNFPYGGADEGPSRGRPRAVGSYKPNRLGLYDLHGNVWEWCSDWYGDYPDGPSSDPCGPPDGLGRVFRGGSWYSFGEGCRAAHRVNNGPTRWNFNLSFRVAAVPRE